MVQSITEREKGTPSDSDAAGAVRTIADGPPDAPAKAAAAHAPTNSRLRILFTQKFPADILQHVCGALDAHFSGQNRVFIFDAENTFESDVHVSLNDRLPEAGAVTVANSAESFRRGVEIGLFEGEVQDAVLVDIFGIESGVLHVGVKEGALLAEEMNDFDGIAALPEKVAQIAVRADFFADGFAELHQRSRVVNNEVRMHFERQAFDAVIARMFGRFLPVGDDLFFPLPVLHLGVLGRPAVGDPVGLGILGSSAGAAGKADDDFHVEHFGEEDGLAKGVYVFLGVLGIGMNGVPVATEGGNANPLVFKFFLPGLGLAAIGDELVEGTMAIVGIAAGPDFHGLEAEGADLIEHGVEREMFVDGGEDADGNLAEGTW